MYRGVLGEYVLYPISLFNVHFVISNNIVTLCVTQDYEIKVFP